MKKSPQVILQGYFLVALLIGLLDLLFPGARALIYFKFFTSCSLFFMAYTTEKKYQEQYLITAACLGAVVADGCFLLAKTTQGHVLLWQFSGGLAFFLAYLLLIYAFSRGKPRKGELITALVLMIALFPTLFQLAPVLRSYPFYLYYGAFGFALILLFFTWTALGTLYRGYFTPSCAGRIALAGSLIFISDLAVAHAVFNPAYSSQFTPWLSCLIWLTYIPAWALLVTVTAAPRLYR